MLVWFYEQEGAKFGPVSLEELQSLLLAGKVHENSLVWTKDFGAEWRPIHKTDVNAGTENNPPPLPPSHINNGYAWTMALLPLIGLFTEKIVSDIYPQLERSEIILFILYWVAYFGLGVADEKKIENSGRNIKSVTLKKWTWIVPVYLYQRSKALTQKPMFFATWIGSIIFALAIQNPDILNGKTYLGVGIPPCNARASLNQVKAIFDDIPLVRTSGVRAITVGDATEKGSGGAFRICTAKVSASNGNVIGVTYSITDQNGSYYYRVEVIR